MAQAARTRWGGVTDPMIVGSGFFRAELIDGAWWLVDPDGGRFLSKGVNTVCLDQDRIRNSDRIPYRDACLSKYGSIASWRAATSRRLASWGLNTLGAWSDDAVASAGPSPLAVCPTVDLGAAAIMAQAVRWRAADNVFPDVFDPAFEAVVGRVAAERCGTRRDQPDIVGWFIDNEPRWSADWRGNDELLTIFLNQPAGSPGRDGAVGLMRRRHGNLAAFNKIWDTGARSWDDIERVVQPFGPSTHAAPSETKERADPKRAAYVGDCEAFVALLAERYFALTTAAIRSADPNHLVLGCRFALVPPQPVIEAAARHVDVISFNCYDADPLPVLDLFAATGKPCLIGEFAFRGRDSGLPNTCGAGPVVPTQVERAEGFTRYVTSALRRPALVGYHWFEHHDQPAAGRFDGENSNFGLLSIEDHAYGDLTRAMTTINARAEDIHELSARAARRAV